MRNQLLARLACRVLGHATRPSGIDGWMDFDVCTSCGEMLNVRPGPEFKPVEVKRIDLRLWDDEA